MFGLFNKRRRRTRTRGWGRRAEQLQLGFMGPEGLDYWEDSPDRSPITDPRLLLPAPEPDTKKEFLRRHGPRIKQLYAEAWRSATPDQRSRLNPQVCRTMAWEEYQTADPDTDITIVIQEAILRCAYGRAGMGTRPEWYLLGEATREELGLEPRRATRKEEARLARGASLRAYQNFQNQFKEVIDGARKEAKITTQEAKRIAWQAAKAGVTDPAQLARVIVQAGKVDKMASSGKISTRNMSPAQRAALSRPAGASCTSTAGKRAALRIITRNPKGADLAKLVDAGSKDTLLYMLQASVSPAAAPNKTRTRVILAALAKKGIPGTGLRGNLKKGVEASLGAKATSSKRTTTTTTRRKTTSKRTTAKTPSKRTTAKTPSKRTTGQPRKPAGYDAALKRRFAREATAKDNTLINAYNAAMRAAKAGAAPPSRQRTTSTRRAAESRGTGSYNDFGKAFLPEIHKALDKAGKKKTLAMKILGYAWTQLGGKDQTRAGQKPLIAKAIKAKIKKTTKKRTTAKTPSKRTTAKTPSKRTTAKTPSKRTTGQPRKPAGYAAALKRRFAREATAKDNTLINAYNKKAAAFKKKQPPSSKRTTATVPASVRRRTTTARRKTGTDTYKVSGKITIKG